MSEVSILSNFGNMQNSHEKYMSRAIELANLGKYYTAPNPSVGAVIVHEEEIIGEGYHAQFGEAHAEVNAINAVQNRELLKNSTLYVTLEPCAHFGKTPPCSNLIVENKIPKVVIATTDPFAKVNGKGIAFMKENGVEVITQVLEAEGKELNRRFFTFHQKKRPYVILKFAKSKDGFLARKAGEAHLGNWITGALSKQLVHLWRAEEQAILVGKNTALIDNPVLTCREVDGKNPIRMVIDLNLELPKELKLFDQSTKTVIFNEKRSETAEQLHWVKKSLGKAMVQSVVDYCVQENILSLIIEGGAGVLNQFIAANVWDEARIFVGNQEFEEGIEAPILTGDLQYHGNLEQDQLFIYRNLGT
tara:strand:- start:39505 stop:40587 length:1083 start_codon:yes stop_codon:yes gene_type:complete